MSVKYRTILEQMNVAAGSVPVDMAAAAMNGDWVSLKGYDRLLVVLFKAAGTAGDDPTLTIEQAKDVAGTDGKALSFTEIWKKQGALASIASWTTVTQSAANTYTDAASAETQAIWAVEIKAADLDVSGGFDCLRATVADVGTGAQLGCLLYLMFDPRYAVTQPINPLVD